GEIFSDTLDLNKYTYYIVNKQEDIREEIDEEEYRGMQAFIHQSYSEYMYDHADLCDEEEIKTLRKSAKIAAQLECYTEYGALPRRIISKVPTKKAFELFMPYFDLLPTGQVEKKEDSSENLAVHGKTDSFSVVGRDPLQKDWDRVAIGLCEDELWDDWWLMLDRIEDDLRYFWKLAMEVSLEQQTRKQVNRLLKDRWKKYTSMLTCSDGSKIHIVPYEQKRKLQAMGIIRKNSLLQVS
ncbi:hypothetical protein N7610_32420, partial [Priestia megaterium]|nr:hypothetical protein [Priestia megaterium]